MRRERGFTLIELIVVVAIVGILAAIAYPAYTDQVVSSRRSEGRAMLLEIMSAQERYYTQQNTYTDDLTDLGYGSSSGVPSEDGWYEVDADDCGGGDLTRCVELEAVAQGDQDAKDTECGDLTLDSLGQKSAETGTVDECW